MLTNIAENELSDQLLEAFREADGGTLYLDEITEIPPRVQDEITKILRYQSTMTASGATESIDVRIIAATAKNPRQFVEEDERTKKFYNLLNSVYIKMPALRERKEDICLLINYFLTRQNTRHANKIYNVSPSAQDHLLSYNWPGNVIQLENVIERAFALGVRTMIEKDDLPKEIITFGEIAKIGS